MLSAFCNFCGLFDDFGITVLLIKEKQNKEIFKLQLCLKLKVALFSGNEKSCLSDANPFSFASHLQEARPTCFNHGNWSKYHFK